MSLFYIHGPHQNKNAMFMGKYWDQEVLSFTPMWKNASGIATCMSKKNPYSRRDPWSIRFDLSSPGTWSRDTRFRNDARERIEYEADMDNNDYGNFTVNDEGQG